MKRNLFIIAALLLFAFTLTISTASAAIFHSVKPQETLWKIAKQYNVSMESILQSNPDLRSEKDIKAGITIVIPDQEEEIIPVDNYPTAETRTLVLHGTPAKKYSTPAEKAVNVMTVNGRTVTVPTYKSDIDKYQVAGKPYRSKFNNLASRGIGISNGLVKSAFGFIGVPYVFGGSTPSGFDCSGFVQYVYRMHGIKIPRMAHHQYYAGTPISKAQLQPGDLVFFETYTVGISHVGMYIGDSNFIHASSKGCVRVDSLNEQFYNSRYRGAARY